MSCSWYINQNPGCVGSLKTWLFISPRFTEWLSQQLKSELYKVQQCIWLILNFLLCVILNLSYQWGMGVWCCKNIHCYLFSPVSNCSLAPFCTCVQFEDILLITVFWPRISKLQFFMCVRLPCNSYKLEEKWHTFKKETYTDLALMDEPHYKDKICR